MLDDYIIKTGPFPDSYPAEGRFLGTRFEFGRQPGPGLLVLVGMPRILPRRKACGSHCNCGRYDRRGCDNKVSVDNCAKDYSGPIPSARKTVTTYYLICVSHPVCGGCINQVVWRNGHVKENDPLQPGPLVPGARPVPTVA